jgi:hypothetical protein
MKQAFVESRWSDEKRERVRVANEIIVRYQAQGLKLTLRQLYYQHVIANLITNEEKSYKNLGKLISDARLAGLIDWDAIEDRVRVPKSPPEFEDLDELLDAAFHSFRLPRWAGQQHYVELWVEKDALSGVLLPLANEFHVTMMVNKGYSSQSALYEAAQRMIRHENNGQTSILFYLGDHDPSGEDMVRDIRERLHMFGSEVMVQKLALTMEQIEEYNPPPNPAKMSDSRALAYVGRHGNESWEVDALPPEVLGQVIREAFSHVLDEDKMDDVKAKEEEDKKLLRTAVASLRADNQKKK